MVLDINILTYLFLWLSLSEFFECFCCIVIPIFLTLELVIEMASCLALSVFLCVWCAALMKGSIIIMLVAIMVMAESGLKVQTHF